MKTESLLDTPVSNAGPMYKTTATGGRLAVPMYEVDLSGAPGTPGSLLKPMEETQVQQAMRNIIDEAVNFVEGDVAEQRRLADSYYQGRTRLKITPGRSQIIVTKVRDGVKSVIPSLARVFTQTDTVAEFYSDDESDEQLCNDATVFCNAVFAKAQGYTAFIQAVTDALKAKVGVIKVVLEKNQVVVHDTRAIPEGSTAEELPEITGSEGQLTEASESTGVITHKSMRYIWKLICIPPEELLVDANATCAEDARIIGHRRNVKIYEAIAMGFDYETLLRLSGEESSLNIDKEKRTQLPRTSPDTGAPMDPTSREILIFEGFVRMDEDGDGIAELRKVVTGGLNYKILSDEPVNYSNLAVFKTELQPHVFFPLSLADDLIQDQDAQTALLRSIIDNAAQVNTPRTVFNERAVNADDLKNGEIGAQIRVTQMGQIEELVTPFVAGQTLPVLQYMNEVSEQRSGITKLSQGLDADALQSTTKLAAQAAINAADARIEMMARNIGETGLKELFTVIMKTAMYEINKPTSIRIPEGYRQVNPHWWHDQIGIRITVGLGSGRIDEKKAALVALLPVQQQIMDKGGIYNEICSWTNLRNTLKSILRLSGIHDIGTYLPYVADDKLKELDKAMKDAAAKQLEMQSNESMTKAYVQVETQKVQQKAQNDMASLQQKHQGEIAKLQAKIMELTENNKLEDKRLTMEDDRVRDGKEMDFVADMLKIGVDINEANKDRTAAETARTPVK